MYEPLDLGRYEIRLLEISSLLSDGGLIQCQLRTVGLDDADLEFAALSYVWGDESITGDILVNGQQRAVTTNLESALQNFQHYYTERGDDAITRAELMRHVKEESHDLSRLRRFFASDCDLHHESDADGESDADDEPDIVQAGDDDVSSTTALKNAIMTNRIIAPYQRARVGCGQLLIWIDALCINQNDLAEKGHQIPMMRDIFAKAACVFSWLGPSDHRNVDLALRTIRKMQVPLRSGPSRTSPHRNTFDGYGSFKNYGRQTMPYSYAAMNTFCRILSSATTSGHSRFFTATVYKMKDGFQGALAKTRAFLGTVGRWRCKDPRDNVFALLDMFQINMIPDYTMSVADVYAAWAMDLYQDLPLGHLLFYSGIGLWPQPLERRRLASWQPDFDMVSEQVSWDDITYTYHRTLDAEVPHRSQPTLSPTRCFTCFGIHAAEVREVATHASKRSVVPTLGIEQQDPRINGSCGFQPLLSILRYLIDGERRLWDKAYATNGSRLWAFVQTVNGCTHTVNDESIPTPPELTLSILRALSPCRLFKEIREHITEYSAATGAMTGSDGFTADELEFLGFESEEQLWDYLTDMQINSDDRVNLPPGVELTAEQQGLLSDFVTRLRIFAQDRSIFYTEDGMIGAGPPGIEKGDTVHVIHGCSLPVLMRKVEGKVHHVGVCYIHGFSGAEGVQVLKDRECDVREVNIV